MQEITVTKVEYMELLRASERLEAVARLIKAGCYVSAKDIIAVLDLDVEEVGNDD